MTDRGSLRQSLRQNLTQMIKNITRGDTTVQVFVYCNPEYFGVVYATLVAMSRKNVTLIDDPKIPSDQLLVTGERIDEV